jgi:integrase/recombinase XerD
MAFLVGYPPHSVRAYLPDLKAWGAWCAAAGVHPFDARRHHVDAWIRVLSTEPLPRTGKPMANSSIARRLSAISAFYDYGIGVDVLAFSPVANVRRPKVSDDSTTVGLSAEELVKLLDTADAHSPRPSALITLLAYNGVRLDEALSADVSDYTYQRGHRVLRIVRKGGKTSTEPLAPPTVRALDAYQQSSRQSRSLLATGQVGSLTTARLSESSAPEPIGLAGERTAVSSSSWVAFRG